MTLVLLIHGLATPGVIIGPNGVVKVAGGLVVLLAVIVALGLIGFLIPADVPSVPGYDSPEALALLVAGSLFFATVASRAVRTFALTRRTGDLVVVGIVWLGMALVPVLILDPYTWVWWTGHALELLGVALVGDLPAAELVAEEEAFLGARVRVLMARLEAKDVSTEEHTRRVAEWAVQIGLTDAEMDVIKRHTVHGDALARELGYPDTIRRPVRGHHERLDGSGYPDGLAGDAIDLETRILAVADVWDALVSPRVYRGAWTPERAMGLLVEETGTGFDPRCVEALRAITGVEPEVSPMLRAA
ncbi:MAG TPA: HD domain-containing phosphohydrolase [Baekduia sp.]|nr:HD domain-containing phosphohydrolase [Baekduia sp.]